MAKAKASKYAKFVQEDYEPHFDRLSVQRRVLGHITPEVDSDEQGPRNTLAALDYALHRDDYTPYDGDQAELQAYLDELVDADLIVRDPGDIYTVTNAGWTELMN